MISPATPLEIRGQSNVKTVSEECHSSAAGGHRGREGTTTKVRQRFTGQATTKIVFGW